MREGRREGGREERSFGEKKEREEDKTEEERRQGKEGWSEGHEKQYSLLTRSSKTAYRVWCSGCGFGSTCFP